MLRYSIRQLSYGGSPVTKEEAKDHIGLPQSGTENDDLLEGLIDAATEETERLTSRTWLDTGWSMELEQFPHNNAASQQNTRRDRYPIPIVLPVAPVSQIVEVAYTDIEGDLQSLGAINAFLDFEPAYFLPEGDKWPADIRGRYPGAVKVTFNTGWSNPTTVPKRARLAILQLVSHWFDVRAAGTDRQIYEVPLQVTNLLRGLSWGNEFEVFAR